MEDLCNLGSEQDLYSASEEELSGIVDAVYGIQDALIKYAYLQV